MLCNADSFQLAVQDGRAADCVIFMEWRTNLFSKHCIAIGLDEFSTDDCGNGVP